MPKAYREKQKEMKRQLKEQWDGEPLEGPIYLELVLKGEGRADADNIIGALMDAANGLLWTDDRVTIIPRISVSWEKAPKADSLWRITIHDAG
jgi:Holliday junction resolvase RusA-like endonuclease